MTAEKSSKCLHQSSGAGENAVQKIKSSAESCQRISSAESTAKALFRRGLLGAWRTCSVDPRSVNDDHNVRVPVEDEEAQRCVDTGRWRGGSWG